MRWCFLFFFVCFLANAKNVFSLETSVDEQTIWGLERAYWRYVENNDLTAYSDLWHKDFLGWPGVSSEPVHKDLEAEWKRNE
jgi:hypothetical protein